jgi:hypothetical protein
LPNTFNNAQLALTTVLTDVYQAPLSENATSVILSFLVANIQGGSVADVTVIKTDSSDTEQSRLCHTIPVPQNTSLEVIPNKIVLKSGEKLRALASANSYLSATVSVLEVT